MAVHHPLSTRSLAAGAKRRAFIRATAGALSKRR
jgi:hypothetical protein